jgi:hypothetical protein
MQAVRMSQFFHTHHRIWAMSPSHWTADFRHDWGSGNTALTVDGLAAGPLAFGVKASSGFFTSCYCPLSPFGLRLDVALLPLPE